VCGDIYPNKPIQPHKLIFSLSPSLSLSCNNVFESPFYRRLSPGFPRFRSASLDRLRFRYLGGVRYVLKNMGDQIVFRLLDCGLYGDKSSRFRVYAGYFQSDG